MIKAYRNDSSIRSLFPFSKELEELILLEPDYDTSIPICRIDIFYDEMTKDFYFCEFNTDGTSAMNENHKLNEFLSLNNVFMNNKPEYEIMELIQSWIDAFLLNCKHRKDIHVGIVDFLENAYLSELYVFEKEFQKRGISCEVIDIRKLKYDGNR